MDALTKPLNDTKTASVAAYPICFYHAGEDTFFYLSRTFPHTSYILTGTKNVHLWLLKTNTEEQIGFKICKFSQLPRLRRYQLLAYTKLDHGAMWNFEEMKKLDMVEQACLIKHAAAASLASLALEQLCC